MPKLKIHIFTEAWDENEVLRKLEKIKGVEEISVGFNGITATVKADTMENLKEIVTYQIRRIDKIRTIVTSVVER